MPFGNHVCFLFSGTSVRENAPELPGVYGLSNAREWVFVGDAESIQTALLAHLEAMDEALSSHAPTGFTFELRGADRHVRKNQPILELKPVCNRPSSPKPFGDGDAAVHILIAKSQLPAVLQP
jgi:hypothetical protein